MTCPALAFDTDRPTRCAFIDPDLFHADEHGRYPVRLDQLRRLCATCYAQPGCLATALADPTLTGFWGGLPTRSAVASGATHASWRPLMTADPLAATDADIANELKHKPADQVARDLQEPLSRVLQIQQRMRVNGIATPAAGRPTPVPPAPPVATAAPRTDALAELIAAGLRSTSKRTQAVAQKAKDAVDQLRDLVAADQERRKAEEKARKQREEAQAEIRRLEEQLRAAKARLRGKTAPATDKPVQAPPRSRGQWVVGDGKHECRKGCGHVSPTPQGRAAHERFCGGAA